MNKEYEFDTLDFISIAEKAQNHLNHIVFSSKNKEELLTRLELYWQTFKEVLEP